MLTVNKQVDADKTLFTLTGTIDDTDDITKLVGHQTGPVIVNCKGVTRINSIGIKNWIKHFSDMTAKNPKVVFDQISPALVEQVNLVKNFITAPIISVALPYRCTKCDTALIAMVKTEDLKQIGSEIPPTKCPKCSAEAAFDDIAEEYLAFLSK